MQHPLTESARRVIGFAMEEAELMQEGYASTEHLLLGLLREEDCVAVMILGHMGLTPDRIRGEVYRHRATSRGGSTKEIQITPRFKRIIELAYEEARALDRDSIGTEHLLLGLIREGEGMAGRVLSKFGVYLKPTRWMVGAWEGPTRRYPDVGDMGVLGAIEYRAVVEFPISSDAFTELAAVYAAKDSIGYREMREHGRLLLLPLGSVSNCWISRSMRRREISSASTIYEC